MRRPRLTKKVLRGLTWVESNAAADFESVMSDEVPSLSAAKANDVATALDYLRDLQRWARNAERGGGGDVAPADHSPPTDTRRK